LKEIVELINSGVLRWLLWYDNLSILLFFISSWEIAMIRLELTSSYKRLIMQKSEIRTARHAGSWYQK
jgi:hypothetical protein